MGPEWIRLFPPFRLDARNAQLWRGDQEISLRRKTFEVLLHLVDHPGQLVTKAALLDAAWAGVTVSDSMPAVCVGELRKALGDEVKTPRFIETVHGRGYRFIAQVTIAAAGEQTRKRLSLSQSQEPIMVGREDELARLQSWYSDVLEGQRRVVFVAGEAGIGKTTFVQAFLDSISKEDMMRLGRGQCVEQYGAGEPYLPVLEALSRLGQEPAGQRVIELLHRFAPTWLVQMPELLTYEDRIRLQGEMQGVTQQRMLREMTQALEALSTEAPLVLLLEDLHWSDFSTLELISAVARRSQPARMLIVGTYRPAEMFAKDHPLHTMKQELELHHHCEELRLKLLNKADVAGYLAKRFPTNGSRWFDSLAPLIHKRTDGNPLFMVNVVDYLADAGLLVSATEASAKQSAEALRTDRIDTPRSIRQMIECNLERLRPEEQVVLEGASAVGSEFSAAAVAAALDCSQKEVEECCTRLARREQFVTENAPIAWPDGTVAAGFRFHHALYQEVLYDRLPAGHRVQLHRRVATREEAGYGERAGEVATELAHHYNRANDIDKAIHYFRLAGERAVGRGATVEAEGHYVSALKLLSELPENTERDHRELRLLLAVGPILIAAKGYASAEVERVYIRSRELCERFGDPTQLFVALYGLWVMHLNRGKLGATRELAEKLLWRTRSAHESALLLYAQYALGNTAFWMGDFVLAKDHFERAIALYDPERHPPLTFRYFPVDARVMCLSYAAWTLWYLGYPDQALNRVSEALALARKLSHGFSLGLAEMGAGMLHLLRREASKARESTESGIAVSAEYALTDFLAWATTMRGSAMVERGHHEEGIRQIQEGFAAIRTTLLRPYLLSLQAEACKETCRLHEGLNAVKEALVAANEHEIRHYEPEMYRLKGELLLGQNHLNALEAQKCFERAIEIAREQSAKSFELRATVNLARLLAKQSDLDKARAMLVQIYGWFTEGFDTADLKDARALLDKLNSERSAPHRFNRSRPELAAVFRRPSQ